MQKVALLFPGQGSQYIGMGKKLCSEFDIASKTFDEASELLDMDLKKLCFDGNVIELNWLSNIFISILTLSVATFRVYNQEIGILPVISAGHSLGEYSALTCSGAMKFSDALKIVEYRGKLAQQISDSEIGAMTVFNGIDKISVENECKQLNEFKELVNIACYNSPNQFVISGFKDAVYTLENKFAEKGAAITPLLTSAPFHCGIMSEAAELLKQELKKICFNNFSFPVISNVFARPYVNPEEIKNGLVLQMTNSVQWNKTIEYIEYYYNGCTLALEMGPKSVLTDLLKENTDGFKGVSFGQYKDRENLFKLLAENTRPDMKDNPQLSKSTVVTMCLAMAVSTENRNFDENEYYQGVINNYEQIEIIQNEIEVSGNDPTIDQMKQAIHLLKAIFETKKVPAKEQIERFQRIFSETRTHFLLEDFIMPKNGDKEADVNKVETNTEKCGISKKDIAIIGMGAKFSKANNIQEYWENIKKGLDCIGELPSSRKHDVENYLNHIKFDRENIKYKKGSYLDEIDKFDINYLKISPQEAKLMDPNQRLFFETALSAIEDAGYGGEKLYGSKTGVYVGFRSYKQKYWKMIEDVDPSLKMVAYAGNSAAMIPSRVAYHLNLTGPSIVIDSACSSSLVAVHLACRALREGDCDYAVVGGVTLEEIPIYNMDEIGVESSDSKTRAFDNSADGTIEGEGVASILLKPLDKALADRDSVYAVIKGSAVNNDGCSLGITAPNVNAQENVIVSAWEDAGIDPETITYVEAHGTATKLGDPTEILGLKKAFERYTKKKQFCAVGSVKSNIGHLNAVAGLAGLIKVVMALGNKQIPSTIHFSRPNKRISFYKSPVYISDSLKDWKTEGKRVCGINSFGISGTNCHVVLEEVPEGYNRYGDAHIDEGLQILTISAESKNSLKQIILEYHKYICTDENHELGNICFTANTGRSHYSHRIAIIAKDIMDLKEKISKIAFMSSYEDNKDLTYFFHNVCKPQKKGDKEVNSKILFSEINIKKDKYTMKDIDMLEGLCRFYVNGGNVNWELLYGGLAVKRVNIPTYAFEKKRYWLNIADNLYQDIEINIDDMFSTALWEEKELTQNTNNPQNGTTLLLNDINGLGKQIAKRLKEYDNEVIEVNFGECFRKISNNEYYISDSIEDLQNLFHDIKLYKLKQIIHLRSILHYNNKINDERQLKSRLKCGLYSFFNLIKSIGDLARKLDVVIVSEFFYEITKNEEIIVPENAALVGLGKAVTWEFPELKCRFIDIDGKTDAENIVKEIRAGYQDYLVAYRNKHRYVEYIKKINISEGKTGKLQFNANGAYVITGGTGGIGLEISSFLVSKYKVNLALINRINIYEKNENDKLQKKLNKIDDMKRSGSTIGLYTADVSEEAALSKTLDQIRSEFGKINGIIHIAGVNTGGTISEQSLDEFDDILLSKVYGTKNLHNLTQNDDLDFFIMFSSVITLCGGKGKGAYTAANAYLDSFAAYRNRLGKRTLTINWPSWNGIGFSEGKSNVSIEIFKALDSKYALEIFDRSINDKHNRIIVGEINNQSEAYDIIEYLPFKFSNELESIVFNNKNSVDNVFCHDKKMINKVTVESNGNGKVSDIERMIAQVLGRVLGYNKLNVNDNFFELGANSILAVKMEVEMENEGINITYADINRYPTIKKLASYIIDGKGLSGNEINNTSSQGGDIENTLNKNGVVFVKGNFEPFNEVFFKGDCFYSAFMPIVRAYKKSVIPFLFSDIIKYSFNISDKGESDIEYVQVMDIYKIFEDMGILLETKLKSVDVVSDIKKAIDNVKPVVVFVDSYYETIREDVYEKYHLPHSLLFLGYDEYNQLFHIMEHDDRYSLSYKRRSIGFSEIKTCYEGFLNITPNRELPSYFEFYLGSPDTQNTGYIDVIQKTIIKYASFALEKQEEIISGLKQITKFTDDFKNSINDNEAYCEGLERFVVRLNRIIIARESEFYRIQHIFPLERYILKDLSKIIEHWMFIRAKLTGCIYRTKNNKEVFNTCLDKLYQMYDLEYSFHKALFILLNQEMEKHRAGELCQ